VNDDAIFASIFSGEGGVRLTWQVGTRCTCWNDETKQPLWGHDLCGGRSQWQSHHASGQHSQGEAQLTTPLSVKPNYVDDRVRDRFTVVDALGDAAAGSVWYPAAKPVPFIFAGAQRAWRVQLQGLDQSTRTLPQP
jgi:hypothetical protein